MSEQNRVPHSVDGRVVSSKRNKTITVLVERKVAHPLYGKVIRRSTKLHANDEHNDCTVGDLVQIQECRPLAKTKTWRLVKILAKAAAE